MCLQEKNHQKQQQQKPELDANNDADHSRRDNL